MEGHHALRKPATKRQMDSVFHTGNIGRFAIEDHTAWIPPPYRQGARPGG